MRQDFKRSRYYDTYKKIKKAVLNIADDVLFYLGIIAFFAVVYDLGFNHTHNVNQLLHSFYSFCLVAFFLSLVARRFFEAHKGPGAHWAEIILLSYLAFLTGVDVIFKDWFMANTPYLQFFAGKAFIYIAVASVFLIELSKSSFNVFKLVNPAFLFAFSFLFLIIMGAALLLLPKATVNGISTIDAIFTATSAVCVTGLTVVDTGTAFTSLGKSIILVLIQIGGLGIMTFTSFFGFFFQGAASFSNQLFLKDFVNDEKLGEVFNTLFKIIFITLLIELIGAILIYTSLDSSVFSTEAVKIKFAVFHSISAFCNAGFSTFPNNLYDNKLRYNYNLHLVIAWLIILGGLGFPIVFNYFKYFRHYLIRRIKRFFLNQEFEHTPRIINVNSKIVVITTSLLLLFGTILYFITEQHHTLAGHNLWGKIVTSFFGAVTPRTAGFNTVDMTLFAPATILIYLMLMWIGASPGSTGGGIKTTTFAIAILNTLSISKGKNRTEAYRREIAGESLRRAFAVMILSFIVIGASVFLISIFDSGKNMLTVIFESISAFGTVGLSLGLTSTLSDPSKLVLIITMFIGRVGALTLIIAFIRKVKVLNYNYPQESILIT